MTQTPAAQFHAEVATGALTAKRIVVPNSNRVTVLNWPGNITTFAIRINSPSAPAWDVLGDGNLIVWPVPIEEIYVTTDAGATGGTIRFLFGAADIQAQKQYAAGGISPAGNGNYPVYVTLSGGGTIAANTWTHTTLGVTNSSQAALAANTGRKYALFINDSANVVYLKVGATAVANQGIRLEANGGSFELDAQNASQDVVNAIAGVAGPSTLLIAEVT